MSAGSSDRPARTLCLPAGFGGDGGGVGHWNDRPNPSRPQLLLPALCRAGCRSFACVYASKRFNRQVSSSLTGPYKLHFFLLYLNIVLFHGQRATDSVQLKVKATRIAYSFALIVAAPKRSSCRLAIGTAQSQATGGRLCRIIQI